MRWVDDDFPFMFPSLNKSGKYWKWLIATTPHYFSTTCCSIIHSQWKSYKSNHSLIRRFAYRHFIFCIIVTYLGYHVQFTVSIVHLFYFTLRLPEFCSDFSLKNWYFCSECISLLFSQFPLFFVFRFVVLTTTHYCETLHLDFRNFGMLW